MLFSVAFSLLGPMFPLSQVISLSLPLAVAAQLMVGLGGGMLDAGALVHGLSDLREMGVEEDPSFANAFSSLFLSCTPLG